MHGVRVCHRVKQMIFTIPVMAVNLQISNVYNSAYMPYTALLTYKRFLAS